ncbi:hypothetical protein E4U38_007419 [Claviceps purpurea]|nr:hypothetical protein E4U38_007419 [Claviceps purpurea]
MLEIPGYYYGTNAISLLRPYLPYPPPPSSILYPPSSILHPLSVIHTNIPADTTRKKYFKIENSHTAPSQAPWSADSVKKRRVEDLSRDAARKKAQTLKRHIKRHALRRDLVCGNLLRRETEGDPAVPERDTRCAAWASGVVDKGRRVKFPDDERETRERIPNLDCLWVGSGIAYTCKLSDMFF